MTARSEGPKLPDSYSSALTVGIAFSPDSRTLAYNENEEGTILFWDFTKGWMTNHLAGHHGPVTALAFSLDGRTLASGSDDRTARLWNIADGLEKGPPITNPGGGFSSLAFSPDGRTLAMGGAGGAGRVIRLVDIETGAIKAERRGHLGDISSLVFTPDGVTLLSASRGGGSIRVWDVVPGAKEQSVHDFGPNSIYSDWRSYGPALCLSPDGLHLLTVYTDDTFSLWDTLRLDEQKCGALPFADTLIAAVAPGGRQAAFGSRQGEVTLWDAATRQALPFADPGKNRIHRLVFSMDGRHLAAADNARPLSQMDGGNLSSTIRVWDVEARKETHVFSNDGELLLSLTFSADSKALMAGFSTGSIKLWPLSRSGQAATFPGHRGQMEGLALLPDGQTLVSASTDVRFWDVLTRREKDKLNSSPGLYLSLAVSPDGRRLAAGARDGRIIIWDVASHQEVATLDGHKEWVRQLAFTPDGDHLVSVGKDHLRVWRAASWAETEAAEKEARK